MRWISPYIEEGNWYKGNLHTHTHVSDGGFSVDYAVIGYQHMAKHDFVVLTDHNYRKMHPENAIPFEQLNEQYKEKNFTIIEGTGNLATDVWDEVLSRGKKVWAIGNDDCHSTATFWVVWNTVRAKSNSKEDLMAALKQGSNYCGNGAEFGRIEVQGDKLIVECSDRDIFQTCVKIFRFIGKNGECLKMQCGTERYAEYQAKGDELYRLLKKKMLC